jgi:hypothetical protein
MTLFVTIEETHGRIRAVHAFLSRKSAEKAKHAWRKRHPTSAADHPSAQRHRIRITVHECDLKP